MRRISFAPALGTSLLMALPARAAEQAAEAGERFAGIPIEVWKTANLALILGFLIYVLKGPLRSFFQNRRGTINEQLRQASRDRDDAVRLAEEMEQRLSKLAEEIALIREQGIRDGEAEKREQLDAAEREAEELRRSAGEEIDRRLSAAKAELTLRARELSAEGARQILASAVSEDDRRRLFEESVKRIEAPR